MSHENAPHEHAVVHAAHSGDPLSRWVAVFTVLLDKQLRLRHFSPQAQQLFGFPPDSVGQPMAQLSQMFSTGDTERMVVSAGLCQLVETEAEKGQEEACSECGGRILGNFGELTPGNESRCELFAIE